MSLGDDGDNKVTESANDKIFDFPLLIDSFVKGGVITNDEDMKNSKEKISECSLELSGVNNEKQKLNFFIDYETLYNLNYDMKSFINQVNETIKNFNK